MCICRSFRSRIGLIIQTYCELLNRHQLREDADQMRTLSAQRKRDGQSQYSLAANGTAGTRGFCDFTPGQGVIFGAITTYRRLGFESRERITNSAAIQETVAHLSATSRVRFKRVSRTSDYPRCASGVATIPVQPDEDDSSPVYSGFTKA